MSAKLTGQPKTKRINAQLVKEFHEMEAVPGDRPMSELRLRVYRQLIAQGKLFRPPEWVGAFCRETGATYRVNGKHTSAVMSGMDPLPELYAIVSYWECDTLREVSELYSTFDSRMQSRNVSDINRSFASCVPELEQVDMRTLNACATALWYAELQEGYKAIQPQERAERLLEHPDFVTWVYSLFGSNHKTHYHLKRMAVFAAMFLCHRKHPQQATKFFTAVRDETGQTPHLPDRKLAKWLLVNANIKGRRASGMAGIHITDREIFVKVIHWWNAWRTDEPTEARYVSTAKVPSVR